MNRFTRYVLRTTDAGAARVFYTAVLGHERAVIFPLHEQALARGARPHWLGVIDVEDVEKATAALVEQGAGRLAPAAPMGNGMFGTLRDAGGAIVGLTSDRTAADPGVEVAWHALHSLDLERSIKSYAGVFHWHMSGTVDLGAGGLHHEFAWAEGLPSVGSIAAIAGREGVHPHWLFQFTVDNLDEAIAAVRSGGGVVPAVVQIPNGGRFAVCDDPQGAAFALAQAAG